MIFNKKKNKMIDVRELQKRGVVRIQKKEINIPTTQEGFVEIGKTKPQTQNTSNANFFGFMNNSGSEETFSTEQGGYNKRQVDQKITDLDNKIYKLEQRVELLERKAGVNQADNKSIIGW